MANKEIDVPFPEIELLSDGVYLENPDKGSMKISDIIRITKKIVDVDNRTIRMIIEFDSLGKIQEIIVTRKECLDPISLLTFQNVGLDIHQFNKNYVVKHLLNEEKLAEVVNSHSKIGFGEYGENIVYKLHQCTGIKSIYTGNFEVKPKGNKIQWLKMFEDEVQGNSRLELISCLSLSSIVIGFIGERYSLETLIVHLSGNSSTGKTTALRLAISMFGSPKISNNSLFSTYNMTENAMVNRLGDTKGVPFAFDEISTSKMNNFTNLIYTLSSGIDKARLNKNAELREQKTWLGTIFSNGERSLLSSANKNAGLQIRVVELEQDSWTSSSQNAENINSVISNNYGHIALEFADYLICLGIESVSEMYNKDIQILKQVMQKANLVDEFTSRRANKLAIILTTVKLFQKYLDEKLKIDIKLSITEMIKILLDVERESIKSRNIDKSALEHIRQYILDNKHKFEKSWDEKPKGQLIGKLTKKKDCIELQMTESTFEEMLKEGGFESAKVVLKELKNKGILDSDSDRYTRKRMTDVGKIPVIVVKLPRKEK